MTVSEKSHEYTSTKDLGGGSAGNDLVEPLIETPTENRLSLAQAYAEVVAPTSLPEGYTFDAEANGRVFRVTVPAGGVEEGQAFRVPFPPDENEHLGVADSVPVPVPVQDAVPMGEWRDGLCDCCTLGVVHPVLWNAWCCPLVLVGQVMNRLKITWLGDCGRVHVLLAISIGVYILHAALNAIWSVLYIDKYSDMAGVNVSFGFGRGFVGFAFEVFVLVLVWQTRTRIRDRYNIPEKQCRGCEDCCCAYWCLCCTLSQMARHTADYHTYAAQCCSETGLPLHAPELV